MPGINPTFSKPPCTEPVCGQSSLPFRSDPNSSSALQLLVWLHGIATVKLNDTVNDCPGATTASRSRFATCSLSVCMKKPPPPAFTDPGSPGCAPHGHVSTALHTP